MNIPCPLFFWTLHPRTSQSTSIWLYTFFFSLISCLCGYAHDMFAIAPITLCVKYMVLHDTCTHDIMIFFNWFMDTMLGLWKQLWVPGPDGTPRVLTAKGREKLAKSRCWLQLFWLPFSVPQTPCLLIYVTWNGWLFNFETSRRGQPWKTAFQPKQSVLMQFKRWKVSPYAGHAQSLCAWWKRESGYPRPDIAMTQLEGLAARTVGPRPEVFHTHKSGRQDKRRGDRTGESLPSLDHDQ